MNKRGGIRLSTMEIVLICTLLGSLLLGMIQTLMDERRTRQITEANDDQ